MVRSIGVEEVLAFAFYVDLPTFRSFSSLFKDGLSFPAGNLAVLSFYFFIMTMRLWRKWAQLRRAARARDARAKRFRKFWQGRCGKEAMDRLPWDWFHFYDVPPWEPGALGQGPPSLEVEEFLMSDPPVSPWTTPWLFSHLDTTRREERLLTRWIGAPD